MRSSNKSRSRNKNNNRRPSTGNVVNRVFDSSGPEGKVRGTPQQIIDKYQGLAQDSQRSGDRVNSENFLQHCEHYTRLLLEAQREMNERREAQEAQNQQRQQQQNKQNAQQQPKPKQPETTGDQQPEVSGDAAELFPAQSDTSGLVETPEATTKPEAKAPVKKAPPPAKAADDQAPETAAE